MAAATSATLYTPAQLRTSTKFSAIKHTLSACVDPAGTHLDGSGPCGKHLRVLAHSIWRANLQQILVGTGALLMHLQAYTGVWRWWDTTMPSSKVC
jgi:hypothetical protein